MANELRFLDGNLLFEGGSLAMSNDCCCEGCCSEPGGPPIASFSYEQTSDDPCTINLTDESEPGTCGALAGWEWFLNGVSFSTSQNPSGVIVTDTDDITLEVTDAFGCTDSAVMQINCVDLRECGCCSDDIPSSVTVTMSGWSSNICPSGDCTELNGSFVVPYQGVTNPGARCSFYLDLPNDRCRFLGVMSISVGICLNTGFGDRLGVSITTSSFVIYIYTLPVPVSTLCRGTHELSFSFGGGDDCNYPANITLTI